MSTLTLTDTAGDELEFSFTTESGLAVENLDGDVSDWLFSTESVDKLRALLGVSTTPERAETDPERAKLRVAVDHELRVRFSYPRSDGSNEVRLEPTFLDGEHVEGESYDAEGEYEGYRRFRLDNIRGKVSVR